MRGIRPRAARDHSSGAPGDEGGSVDVARATRRRGRRLTRRGAARRAGQPCGAGTPRRWSWSTARRGPHRPGSRSLSDAPRYRLSAIVCEATGAKRRSTVAAPANTTVGVDTTRTRRPSTREKMSATSTQVSTCGPPTSIVRPATASESTAAVHAAATSGTAMNACRWVVGPGTSITPWSSTTDPVARRNARRNGDGRPRVAWVSPRSGRDDPTRASQTSMNGGSRRMTDPGTADRTCSSSRRRSAASGMCSSTWVTGNRGQHDSCTHRADARRPRVGAPLR